MIIAYVRRDQREFEATKATILNSAKVILIPEKESGKESESEIESPGVLGNAGRGLDNTAGIHGHGIGNLVIHKEAGVPSENRFRLPLGITCAQPSTISA